MSLTPPHNLQGWQSVLGAILLSDRAMYALVIEEGLEPEHFYRERHSLIYGAMVALYNKGEPLDVLTVVEKLRQRGELERAGGETAVDELTAAVPAAGHARRYAQIVVENTLMRGCWRRLGIQESAFADTSRPARARGARREGGARGRARRSPEGLPRVDQVLDEELDKLHRLSTEGTVLTGTPSGSKTSTRSTGGFQRGNLIIIAARPAMGKSALVCNIAENAASNMERRSRCSRWRWRRPTGAALHRHAGAHRGRRAAQGARAGGALAKDPEGLADACELQTVRR